MLDGTKELFLEHVAVLLVQLLVGLPQGRQRIGDLVNGNREVTQHLLSSFGGCVCHQPQRLVRSRVESENGRSSPR